MTAPYIPQAISKEAVAEQQSDYTALVSELGRASPEEIQQVLDERELVELEKGVCSEQVAKLQARIATIRSTIPTWIEFAWAAFLYGTVGGDTTYQTLMRKADFLNDLRSRPSSVSPDRLQAELITGFLNPWRTRISAKATPGIQKQIESIHSFVIQLSQFEIGAVNFDQLLAIDSGNYTISQAVERCYESIQSVHGVGSTATAKILHVLLPRLCVMWDTPILSCFTGKPYGSSDGYTNYLRIVQTVANGIKTDFDNSKASLNPPARTDETLESYLSERMKYTPHKTLAKFLDEYYWITITNKVELPPAWYPT